MKRNFAALSAQSFDLLICGGGIYGAWTAYDAALRGLKVAVVEQNDWGSGTSSASTKLIHGGLRYLETYDFKLVRKSLRERAMLLHAAPHRVWPLHFGVPVFAQQRINRLQLKLGLSLYDILASETSPSMHHCYFDAKQFSAHFPIIKEDTLKGGFTYADAQTDDARLVLELIAGAMDADACCVNYCRLVELSETNGKVDGAIIQDQLTQKKQQIGAKQIVFTTGQWLKKETSSKTWCRLAKGIHLIMPVALDAEALLLTAPSDGRVFFMIPWYGLTLLGTTDTDFNGDVERVTIEDSDIDYLLDAANNYLKTPWTRSDIIGSFAGLRVFKQNTSTSASSPPSAISRDWELKSALNGVHYSVGGKITSSRQDAASIVDAVCAQLGVSLPCATQDRLFPWAPQENFTAWSAHISDRAALLGIDEESAQWLLRRHGVRIMEIFRSIERDPDLAQRIIPSLPFVHADLMHCAATEMVIHLDDLLRRRLPLLILAKLTEDQLLQIAQRIADTLSWNNEQIAQEITHCNKYGGVW
ncbi:glycerol-3-phosphate dehydrogenase/oxidase [Nitrosomonas supralitoralis]|uniref:Glycerol-3-phosphate dehydrogenase/oxidase n=1 Tax=Nitrosomonas supralitoralis TaxID=2116706 RepID=A0A2P7NSV9_9PROT|nr:glycerol-3-phosphate dehydrogenase/oxidase [Nitrosomonas supralitoralis]PSJ16563.1 glycerol-3-phosphate dehydrogenase/oxidase [Nitrosomonas supralitoralis]